MRDNREDMYLLPASPGSNYDSGDASQEDASNLWRVVDDRLRGRWRIMLFAGVLLALLLAPLGYILTDPIYESEGIINIEPVGEVILESTPETRVMEQYTQFLLTQAARIESASVLMPALREDLLRTKEWVKHPNAINILKSGLTVEASRTSQFINVIYEHTDPKEAQDRVNAILAAYEKQADDASSNTVTNKINKLRDRKQALQRQHKDVRDRLYDLASVRAFSNFELQDMLDAKQSEYAELEQNLRWIAITKRANPDLAEKPDELLASPTGAQLDMIDPDLAHFRRVRDGALYSLDLERRRYGDRHFRVGRAEREAEDAQARLERRENEAIETWERLGSMVLDPSAANESLTYNQLVAREQELIEASDRVRGEIAMLNRDVLTVEEIQAERAQILAEIREVDDRVSELELEVIWANKSRVAVVQQGLRNVEPAKDRRAPFAVLGGVGGFALAFGFFFFLGTVDRRAYRLHQVSDDYRLGLRSLGVLPDLGTSLHDPEAAEMAAHCVHQIRNLIEATRPRTERGTVIAITSPYQGDGKTSIALALGFSYAAAGYRTVVVDGDLVGRGLTRQLNLVGAHGFKEVVREGSVNGEIVMLTQDPARTPEARALNAMPVGVDSSIAPQGIRKADMHRMFEQLRDMYDIILVDTGPVLGSLECIPIVSAADGVVLSLRRGRQRSRLEECVQYLNSVGATCYGLVMNCAARRECHRYVSETSMTPTRAQLLEARTEEGEGRRNVLVSAMRAADDDARERDE